ncbi:proline-serine-threonine phosphatase-interacting protein 1 isoform X2 [Hyla sarda]|uniref:proline-serine-threonine phosphatase-interacting protein 1 isoform X2 n=1 Tax=Hyla sarda TaxID=327740 RepID=UPI0024C3B031|nr:proline-serine-threonine phosphatase-interacting protein 1 isoform X2 [Hyla sarda]
MALLEFKDAFWCTDLLLNTGYEVILQRLLDGRKFCKDVEDLLKQRAIAEEKYGKELVQIAKKASGLTEINKLRESFDTLKQQIESIGNSHIQLATTLREEIHSLEEFRERQKQLRKKYENAMERLQKNKVTLYKKTMELFIQLNLSTFPITHGPEEAPQCVKPVATPLSRPPPHLFHPCSLYVCLLCFNGSSLELKLKFVAEPLAVSKKNYEQKCREAEEAQLSFERVAIAGNTKQVEKIQNKVKQSKEAVHDADQYYQQNITLLEKARLEWDTEHVNTCEAFEQQEKDRISILRNSLWVHSNQFSMQCVKDDEMLEVVRESLEQCDVEAEMNLFVQAKTTGRIPPGPVLYESYRNGILPGSSNGISSHSNSNNVIKKISNLLHGCGGSTKNLSEQDSSQPTVTGDSEYASIHIVPKKDPNDLDTGSQNYTVMYDYAAQSSEELDISAGDMIRVIEEAEDGWWTAEKDGQIGLVPGSYLSKL